MIRKKTGENARHILTVQSSQFCAFQEAEFAVQNDNVWLISQENR